MTGAGSASACVKESGLSVCSERERVCAGSSQARRRKSLLRKSGKEMCVVVSAQTDWAQAPGRNQGLAKVHLHFLSKVRRVQAHTRTTPPLPLLYLSFLLLLSPRMEPPSPVHVPTRTTETGLHAYERKVFYGHNQQDSPTAGPSSAGGSSRDGASYWSVPSPLLS